MAPCSPSYISEKKMLCCRLCSTCFKAIQINSCLKRTSAIKVSTISIKNGSHHVPITKSTLFVWWWDTKEGTGKSMKNALHAQPYSKRHFSGWSDVKQWKKQAHSISHCWVTRVWRNQSVSQSVSQLGRQVGRQAVSQSVENSVK